MRLHKTFARAKGCYRQESTGRRLSEQELFLADQRALGRAWDDIAAELGASPEALRKRLARALDRVGRELGFAEGEE